MRVLERPGFYDDFHAEAERFRNAFQSVLDDHAVPARVAGRASFWQFLFTDKEPANQMDVLATDLPRSGALDLGLLKNGVYVLPNVRRFYSAAHTDDDLERALEALATACRR